MADNCAAAKQELASCGVNTVKERVAHIERQINRQSSESSTAAVPKTVLNNQQRASPRRSISYDQGPETTRKWIPTGIWKSMNDLKVQMSSLEKHVLASDFSSNAAASRPDSDLSIERLDKAFNERMAILQSCMGDLALPDKPGFKRSVSDSSCMNKRVLDDDNNSVTSKESQQFQMLIDMIAAQGNSLSGKYDFLQKYVDENNAKFLDKQNEIGEIVRFLTADSIPVKKFEELDKRVAALSKNCISSEHFNELKLQVSEHTSQLRDISNKQKNIDVKFAELQTLIEVHEKRNSSNRATQRAFATDLMAIRAMADECMHYKSRLEKQAEMRTNQLKFLLLQVMKAMVDFGNSHLQLKHLSVDLTTTTVAAAAAIAEDSVDETATINADNEYANISTLTRRNECELSSEYEKLAACLQTHDLPIPASDTPHAKMHRIKCVVTGEKLDEKTQLFKWLHFYYPGKNTTPNSPMPDMCAMDLLVDGVEHRLELWDTSGQEEYDQLRTILYPKTDVFIVLFSIFNPTSCLRVKTKWVPEIRSHCSNIPIVLVACIKGINRSSTAAVSTKQGEQCATDIRAVTYIECKLNTTEITDMLRQVVRAAIAPAAVKSGRN